MKAWNKETRNEHGKFYRVKEYWGVDAPDDLGKPNFTTIEPPDGKCDWDEATQSWIVDETLTEEETKAERRKRHVAEMSKEETTYLMWCSIEALAKGEDIPNRAKAVIRAYRDIDIELPLDEETP